MSSTTTEGMEESCLVCFENGNVNALVQVHEIVRHFFHMQCLRRYYQNQTDLKCPFCHAFILASVATLLKTPQARLKRAIQSGNDQLAISLVESGHIMAIDYPNLFRDALKFGRNSVLVAMLKIDSVDTIILNNTSIISAVCETGNTAIFQYMMLHPLANPAMNKHWPLRCACRNGRLDMAKFVAEKTEVDPTVVDNDALRYAVWNNHVDVVEYLLTQPTILWTIDFRQYFDQCRQMGLAGLARLFAERGMMKLSEEDKKFLDDAAELGKLQIAAEFSLHTLKAALNARYNANRDVFH